MAVIVPPIKCQGIKTKIVPHIKALLPDLSDILWLEPFCGSGVVAFNCLPQQAILSDTNQHIIGFYQAIQQKAITASLVRQYLCHEGELLRKNGEKHFYAIRERFNLEHAPLDFLFLTRSCFNGVMRFNRRGGFNTPFCRKEERFAPAYVTKIANQVAAVSDILSERDWKFVVADFRQTLSHAGENTLIYADPPYWGRHTDYFNQWSEKDEQELTCCLQTGKGNFLLSTWQENQYRKNEWLNEQWAQKAYRIIPITHYYHVGSSEGLRHEMTEAIVTNLPDKQVGARSKPTQLGLFVEDS